MKELIVPQTVERVLLFLAIGGPLIGLILGALLGAHEKRALPRVIAGVLLGAMLTVVYGMWRLYGAITDHFGLDSVANLGLQIIMFSALGCVLGAVILRVSVLLKRWATS